MYVSSKIDNFVMPINFSNRYIITVIYNNSYVKL